MLIRTITGKEFDIDPDEIQLITANGFEPLKIMTRDRFGIEKRYTLNETILQDFSDRMNNA